MAQPLASDFVVVREHLLGLGGDLGRLHAHVLLGGGGFARRARRLRAAARPLLLARRALEVHAVEHLVGGVPRAHDADEHHRPRREPHHLPGPAVLPSVVHHHLPVPHVHRRLDVVAVGAVVAVPEQQAQAGDDVRLTWRKAYRKVCTNIKLRDSLDEV